MIYYAVIDTNVLVSALLSCHEDAATVQLIGRMLAGEFVPVYSSEIMQEYRQVLSRKKLNFDQEMVMVLLLAIEKFGVLTEPVKTGSVLLDMKDLPFYEVAMKKGENCTYLVTGNLKHFPAEPFVVTARQMIAILDEKK